MATTVESDASAERWRAAESVLADLALAVGSLRCAASQRLVRQGISMTHFHVLTLLRHNEAMPMGRLADILDASVSNATGIIDRMEERGLVERLRVPDDRRVVLVQPTQAGLDLVDEVELVKNEVMIRALARLDDVQLERLSTAVSDISAALAQELSGEEGCAADAHPHGYPHAHQHPHSRPTTPAR
jgi:DNA-binding MarR family transcriptional regulator